ncbi:MAG: hypothetical protein HQM08_10130 [Candidatus Riflebacteria bacterium]|nr:hypothetical protein [Candidatus Riflebacteria bacterium]
MTNIVVLVPIYKSEMNRMESYSLDVSLSALKKREIHFIGSAKLDKRLYTARYPSIPFIGWDDSSFASVQGYSRLLLNTDFYNRFIDYEFMLILQTDAIVLRDELDYWCMQPFDYVGAPWPNGVELFVNIGRLEGDKGKRVIATVGNGGFSLRRIKKFISILSEFPDALNLFKRTGSSEDLFFSLMGTLSSDFIVPNEITASRFSMELKPSYYYSVNGGILPMGSHAWSKYEPEFWKQHLKGI